MEKGERTMGTDAPRIEQFACLGCGAPLHPDHTRGYMECAYCGSVFGNPVGPLPNTSVREMNYPSSWVSKAYYPSTCGAVACGDLR